MWNAEDRSFARAILGPHYLSYYCQSWRKTMSADERKDIISPRLWETSLGGLGLVLVLGWGVGEGKAGLLKARREVKMRMERNGCCGVMRPGVRCAYQLRFA
jgi:hypothetical protein